MKALSDVKTKQGLTQDELKEGHKVLASKGDPRRCLEVVYKVQAVYADKEPIRNNFKPQTIGPDTGIGSFSL